MEGRERKRRVCDLSTHINWENAWIKPSTNDQYAVLRTRDRLVPPGHQMNSQQFLSSYDPIILLDAHEHVKTIESLSVTLDICCCYSSDHTVVTMTVTVM